MPKGDPMGHRFCQWYQGLCVALAACLVLCLIPGVEAIKCKKCRARNDHKCRSRKKTCELTHEGAVCMVRRKYVDDHLREKVMTCILHDQYCDADTTIPEDKIRLEVDCCSDRDFCSNDM